MTYLGDFVNQYTGIVHHFTSRSPLGIPTTLVGGVVAVYKGSSLDEATSTGVTLTLDFDGVTGLNLVAINLSLSSFYVPGLDYTIVLSAGTVSGIDVSGEVLAIFSIENRSEQIATTPAAIASNTQISTTAYLSNSAADSYFALRLHTDAWDDASNADRTKALAMATADIDHLDFTNQKLEEDQELEFPRGDQTVVPTDIKIACCEIALSRLSGDDPDEMLADLDVANEGFANVRATYDRKAFPEHIANGIVSATAWRYLRPYLRVSGNMVIERIS